MRSHRFSSAAAAAITVLVTPLAARAQGNACNVTGPITAPLASVTVGSTCIDISQFIQPIQNLPGQYQIVAPAAITAEGGSVLFGQGQNVFKLDPFINFGFTSTNTLATAQTYTIAFFTPITPGLYSSALASGGLTLTDVSGGTTTVAQSGTTPLVRAFGSNNATLTNLGVNILGGPFTATNGTTTNNFGNRTNTFAPTFYNNLEVFLTYTQTGRGSAAFTGGVSIAATTVPEPSTWALLGTGLVGLAGVARRRRNVTA